jgi:SAM-dependent methyltransferase
VPPRELLEAAIGAALAAERGRAAHWDAVYAARAPDALSWYQDRPIVSLELIADAAPRPGASLLDVGGGASRLVDLLLEQGGWRVTVLDLSQVALDRARARLGERAGRVTWLVADVTDWRPPASYDVWHDRAVFHFLVREADRRRYVGALAAALRPGGQAILGTFASGGPERCSGLPVARYEPAALAEVLGPRFRLAAWRHEEHLTPGGARQRFQFSRFVRG